MGRASIRGGDWKSTKTKRIAKSTKNIFLETMPTWSERQPSETEASYDVVDEYDKEFMENRSLVDPVPDLQTIMEATHEALEWVRSNLNQFGKSMRPSK
uniref:Uncharacterized protein n=1 Tax=Polytomella parva TaxID=51329 RepID=A0A7S0UR33_9CHLO